jgi:hypothetical protein
MSINAVLIWLLAIVGLVVLWRLRGRRGFKILLGCLLAVFVLVMVWNVVVSFHAIR